MVSIWMGKKTPPPRPLGFIQVTMRGNVSEGVKKVDPVPINPAVASVEIWAYVGGQKRLDRRYKERKGWLPRNYFQIYFKERDWEADPMEPGPLGGGAAPPVGEKDPVRRPPVVPHPSAQEH